MSEPIDLAALRYDDKYCCDCGSCSVCHWQALARVAADAIEQKDAALEHADGVLHDLRIHTTPDGVWRFANSADLRICHERVEVADGNLTAACLDCGLAVLGLPARHPLAPRSVVADSSGRGRGALC
jgi:hypothetical protein